MIQTLLQRLFNTTNKTKWGKPGITDRSLSGIIMIKTKGQYQQIKMVQNFSDFKILYLQSKYSYLNNAEIL